MIAQQDTDPRVPDAAGRWPVRTWPTLAALREGRHARLLATAQAACDRFRALDALGDKAPDLWVWAYCERSLALRELAFWHPHDPLLAVERAEDERSLAVLRDTADAVRAGRIMRDGLDVAGWAALAATDAHGALREKSVRRVMSKLLADRVDVDLAAELTHSHNVARCRPPLPRLEVDRIVDAVCEWRADLVKAGGA